MTKVKIGIIEGLEHIRESLVVFFNAQEDTVCVIAADSIETFFETIETTETPQVLLCDMGLPGMNSIDGIRKIRKQFPAIGIAMLLTLHSENQHIFNAIAAGASGYILKSESFSEIKKAVSGMQKAGSYMSPPIARKIIKHFYPGAKQEEELFTFREKEVIEWVSQGLSNKLIADKLSISLHTVKFHLRNIYGKLRINSKNELILKVFKKEI